MIVAFQATKVGDRSFTSERHAPFGIPSTLLSLYCGTFLLSMVHFAPECSIKLGTCADNYIIIMRMRMRRMLISMMRMQMRIIMMDINERIVGTYRSSIYSKLVVARL